MKVVWVFLSVFFVVVTATNARKTNVSVAETLKLVKDYFELLNTDISEKYAKFGAFVLENMGDVYSCARNEHEAIKEIAKEFYRYMEDLSEETVAEGLEFLRPYKEDLGSLWDQIKEAAKEIFGRND
ncbi:hypothetical protein Bhyg_05865 [Pseudolycoriella hygida]|uniref:Uncharacterized protein n=1 Tax=Pseudolycoriella hygida TaxID=35572 RepID=A0A9Q0S0E7_9DIPT|nr:hypothetical protein Bhyg_05865 [Pseudolycoriella hygida]